MVALRLAALWLGLIAPASVLDGRATGGEVIADVLEVLDESDESAYVSAELKRGDRVTVLPGGKPGWRVIAPPEAVFNWVDAASIRVDVQGRAEVVADRASVRSGALGARMPGPPRPPLTKGTVVRLLERPGLTLGAGPQTRSWRAIAPSADEVRYVRANELRLDPAPTAPPTVDARVQPTQQGVGSSADEAIRKFEDALQRSRQLDGEVVEIQKKLAQTRTNSERGYDAKGLLQASSRKVDGQKVHALIGSEGVPVAYLLIPPGISPSRLLTKKVGVRGEVRFNESLGARLITVRDLDTLEKSR